MKAEVGYLGPPGTFGEQAAVLYLDRANLSGNLHPYATHAAVVRAVQEGQVTHGVVAVENSLGGAVNDAGVDAVLGAPDVWFSAELALPVEHHLIAAPGTSIQEVTVVMSHLQALAQCRNFLEQRLPAARQEAALSTASAVEEAVRTPGVAAIGTRRAAELHGGRVLAEGIQDEDNTTRFVVLSRHDSPTTGDDKTSIAFSVPHDRPGTLLGVLRELAERQLNMTHIESRPSRHGLGIYIFLLEFQGHKSDAPVVEALRAIEAQSSFFRVLGSYPRCAPSSEPPRR